jgi:hypothetical protein
MLSLTSFARKFHCLRRPQTDSGLVSLDASSANSFLKATTSCVDRVSRFGHRIFGEEVEHPFLIVYVPRGVEAI